MAADVQSMYQYWKNFDLQELQRNLDSTATELAAKQDESDGSRKKLVEQSREFKKNTPEDIRKIVAPLLKSFQTEVDTLSKRSKNAEAAFLTIYKRLIDLPDPVPSLEYAVESQKKARKASDLELENKKLRETLDEYNNEFAEVKNQEVTIKQLKEKLKEYDEKMEANAQLRAKDKEKELQRQFAEKERQLQETQLSVAKKLGEAEHKVSTLQSALDSTQSELFDIKAKYDEATTAKSDEMELIMADLERANERATSAEREVEQLRSQLASVQQNLAQAEEMQQAPDMEQAIHILKRSSLEVELAAKEKEISQLVEDVQRLQSTLTKLREQTAVQVATLEEELASKNRAFKLLEDKIKNQDDYVEIKRELSVMKSMEFGNIEEGDAKAKSLEQLLLEKNRALQTDNTQLKVSNTDLTGSSNGLSAAELFPNLAAAELRYRNPENGGPENGALVIAPTSTTPSPVHSRHYSNGTSQSPSQDTRDSSEAPMHNGHIDVKPHSNPSLQRLQSITRAETNNAQMLDTAHVAQKIREILSTNNIGQRLFAKHVLGLSQGTVSELLSKPKHWDKLTEKGRESYRKMHAWSTDDQNILALKAISPKKGNQPMLATAQREDSATEERINAILSEAQVAMQAKNSQERNQITNAMVESIYQQELARIAHQTVNGMTPPTVTSPSTPGGSKSDKSSPKPSFSINGLDMSSRGRRAQVDQNLTQEMVARIYQEELNKLARAAEKSGNMAEYALYQQELARISMQTHVKEEENKENKKKKDHKREKSPSMKVKREPSEEGSVNSDREDRDKSMTPDVWKHHGPFRQFSEDSLLEQEASRHAGSAFFLVRPRSNSHPAFPETPPPFPLLGEGMSMSPLQRMQSIANSLMTRPQGQNNQRPLKAVLPPITQEQFDRYSNINTDDLVKNVKDTLSQFSISQRLFGEHVLGLSQGSVSDLLARPKPWHMLTQKGREPFIRMKIFLEDQESIPKLVANQYRIAPEKLLRSPNCYANTPTTPSSAGSPDISPPLPIVSLMHPMVSMPMVSMANPMMATMTPLDMRLSSPPLGHGPPRGPSHAQPSMYEIAAMTTELDTLAITSKVKEVLQFHNLGQKLFGEAVLGLSQGSVSELLSKPKPWHMLSLKGREPFIKMHMWLNDPLNLDKLRIFQTEQKARRSKNEEKNSDGPKKARVFFTDEQKETLRMAYAHDPYPNQTTIEVLATQLMVTPKTIVNWFHNHRMRAKQQHSNGQLKEEDMTSNDSMSSETSSYRPMSSTPSQADSQWMFPNLEMAAGSRRSSVNSTTSDVEKAEDMEDAPHDLSSRPLPPPCGPPSGLAGLPSGSSSKRKRAKPKWNFEGTQLDKNRDSYEIDINEEEPCDLSTKKKDGSNEPPEKLRIIEPIESTSDEENTLNNNQKGSSDKNQPPSKDWEERSENIDKLTKNLAVEKDKDWEF